MNEREKINMVIKELIIKKIEELNFSPIPVKEELNLYSDLGFDSLTFVCLIVEIEEMCSIVIEIVEMESCLLVGQLIALVEKKVKESETYD